MATDDRWDDEDNRDRDRPSRRRGISVEDARRKLATPGMLLIVSAIIMLVLWVANVAVLASGYDLGLEWVKVIEGMQPPGPAKQQLQQQIQQMEGRNRSGEYIQGAILAAISSVLNILILIGGMRMRQVRGYGLALAGTICAIIPINSCCCLGLPLGIWALIVLVNPDVKAAFRANQADTTTGIADDLDPVDPDR